MVGAWHTSNRLSRDCGPPTYQLAMATPKKCSSDAVFKKHSGTLLDAISDPLPLAWKLYAKGIITDKTLQDVQVPGQPTYKMNSTILEAVRRAVKANQGRLLEFVTVLEQQSNSPATDVAAMMRSDMSEFHTSSCLHV